MTKNRIVILISCVYIILFMGCSGLKSIRAYIPSVNFVNETVQNYSINKRNKIYIGENIIEKGLFRYMKSTSGEFLALTSSVWFKKNSIYKAMFSDNDGNLYIRSEVGHGIKVDTNGVLLDVHPYINTLGWHNNKLTNVGYNVGDKLFEPQIKTEKAETGSFKIEIIYSGLQENNLRAIYKEYKDDIARPAFYQELSYNLNKSKIIRYKQFKIEIINATNENLEYIVLEE